MSIDIIQKISTDNINKSAHVWSNPVVGTESYVYGTGPQISGIEEQYTNRFDDDSFVV